MADAHRGGWVARDESDSVSAWLSAGEYVVPVARMSPKLPGRDKNESDRE